MGKESIIGVDVVVTPFGVSMFSPTKGQVGEVLLLPMRTYEKRLMGPRGQERTGCQQQPQYLLMLEGVVEAQESEERPLL